MELASKKSALAEIEEKYAATVQQLSNAEDKLRSESEARSALETRYNTTINDFQLFSSKCLLFIIFIRF